jgi:DNA-binding XRE family transcriptional regulator
MSTKSSQLNNYGFTFGWHFIIMRSVIIGGLMPSPVKTIRKTLGMTQTDFGKKMGLSRTSIDNYEHYRKSPRYKIIKKLMIVAKENNIDIKIEDFFENDNG